MGPRLRNFIGFAFVLLLLVIFGLSIAYGVHRMQQITHDVVCTQNSTGQWECK